MSTVDEIFQDALKLSRSERAELAERLALKVEDEGVDPEILEEWRTEIARRLTAFRNGEDSARDWRDVLKDIQTDLEARRNA